MRASLLRVFYDGGVCHKGSGAGWLIQEGAIDRMGRVTWYTAAEAAVPMPNTATVMECEFTAMEEAMLAVFEILTHGCLRFSRCGARVMRSGAVKRPRCESRDFVPGPC